MTTRDDAIHVRHAEIDDLPAITRVYNHFIETSAITFDTRPFEPAARESWFSQFDRKGAHQLFVAYNDKAFAGYAGSMTHRTKPAYELSIETTVYVDPEHARKGVGKALYQRLFSALEKEDVHMAFAGIALPNPGSIAFHRRFGFEEIGVFHEIGYKFGRHHDVMWFEKRLRNGVKQRPKRSTEADTLL